MMDVCEIRDAVVYHDTFEVDVEGAVKISDMTFMTAWELMVLVVDGSGQVFIHSQTCATCVSRCLAV